MDKKDSSFVLFVLMWPMAVGGRAASLFDTLGPASLDPRSQSPSQLRACQRRRELICPAPTYTVGIN